MSEKTTEEKLAGANQALATQARDLAAARGQLEVVTKELDAARTENTQLKAKVAALEPALEAAKARIPTPGRLDPNAPWIAKTRFRMSDTSYIEKGQPLTFDPKNPPAGFTGFVEGVHYERARVFIPAAPAA